jgi:hypothetical protein
MTQTTIHAAERKVGAAMRGTGLAIWALIALAASQCSGPARAAPHQQITDEERYECLTTDNDDDGTEWCVKSGKGMTQAQIDAWYAEEGKRLHQWMADIHVCNQMTDGAEFRHCRDAARIKSEQ